MVKKPVKFRKPRIVTLKKSSGTSINSLTNKNGVGKIRKRADNESDDLTTQEDSNTSVRISPKKASLKDLGPEDKKRVANLVKELAKVGEERELALTQLTQERQAFEERLQILQEEYDSNIKEKLNLQTRFLELQGLLKKYNKEPNDRYKHSSAKDTTTQLNHTTQTSPRLLTSPENIPGNTRYVQGQSKSPNKKRFMTRDSLVGDITQPLISDDIPGNIRNSPGQTKSPKKNRTRQSADVPQPLMSDSGCQFPSPKTMSRQSTPLPGKPENEVLPGNGNVGAGQISAAKMNQVVDKDLVVTGNGMMRSGISGLRKDSSRGNVINSENVLTGNKPGTTQMPNVQAVTGLQSKQIPGASSVPGSATGTLISNHTTSPALLTEIPTTKSQQEPVQSIPRVIPVTGKSGNDNTGQKIGSQLPSYHFLGSVPVLPGSHGSHWPPVYRHPPPGSSGHDPPVYTNRLFDVSVANSDSQRQGTTSTSNRSQSDTSQSFSAELDAVYRLYCREYELQLQLQQQQLELQKQQLQLQHQLQQLEFYQQRQQQQRPTSARFLQQPRSRSKTVISETPDPTPAPLPEEQPQQASTLSDLVPTPDETCDPEQPPVVHQQNRDHHSDQDEEGVEGQANKTIRRITSSKRSKDNLTRSPDLSSHERNNPSTNQISASNSRDNSSSSHHSLQLTDQPGLAESGRVVRKQIIGPEEAAQFRSSLRSNYSSSLHSPHFIRHSTRLNNGVDWTNATDYEFRSLQENKIREHYGLDQRSVHSSQALLEPLGPSVTGARYNLYDSATVAKPADRRRISRDHPRHPHGLGTDRHYVDSQNKFNAAQELEQRTLQNFSLYESTSDRNKGARARFYSDSNHGDSHEDFEPWVSESSGYQRDRGYSLELNYPLQIIDLVEDLEDEPTISSNPRKPEYSIYLSPPRQDSTAPNVALESTDSGFSNVSREKSPLPAGSEDETDIEELNVLEDIFFIQ